MASLNDKEFGSYTGAGSDDGPNNNEWAQRVMDVNAGSTKSAITGESISLAAGAAGTTGVTSTAQTPVLDSSGTRIGDVNDTSFAWVTGTVLTTLVDYNFDQDDATQLAAMNDGEYAIDHNTGRIRYKKDTTATSDTANYTTKALTTGSSSGTSDVNLEEVAGTATDVNNGSVSAGTQRVTLADDGTGVIKVWDGTNTADVNTIQSGTNIRGDKGLTTASLLYGDTGSVSYPIWEADISSSSVAVGVEYGLGTLSFGWYSDGSNYYKLPAFNLDTMAGPEYNPGVSCRTAASGGSIEGTKVTDGTNYLVTMDAAARRGYQQITDGSKSANVSDIDSSAITGDGLNTKSAICLYDSDTTTWLPLQFRDVDSDAKSAELVIPANLRTAGIGGSVEGTKITDGTNYLPTMDAVGRAGYVQVTDGTNTMPTMDDPQRTGIVQLTDGTNTKGVTSFAMASGAAGGGLSLLAAAGKGVFNKVYKMTLTCDTAETLTLSDGFGVYYCAAGVPVVIDFSISGRQGSENTAITVTTAGAANVGAMVEYVTV